ncbi:MAG: Phytoene synthase [uncultured Solirubrobacteraceae bacterium]|uniref:Phytoene synthase n=1 Tax=uncultured Solirubrobacteraceae bacterium TaxID=1162706 RepID=A0A6J4U277_9ACTN|nr:MAG: Phytoene synthase [uncultured Solirubrobacteraceae bacterium]
MSGVATPAVLEEARDTTRRVARTFALACRLLPRDLRDDVYLLYLVFRTLDDVVDDGSPDAAGRVAAVRAWCDGAPGEHTREVAILTDLAARHAIPRDAMREFCAGMEHDLAGATVSSEEELDRYCYRVAGTVGVVMTGILGTPEPERARRAAAALGMAMQRTNILRDIDEDLANGRVYLAAQSIERFGGSFAPGAREALVRDQIARADALYEEGIAGICLLCHGRRAVAAAAAMYREILRQIEREGYGRQAGRAVVPQRRKLAIAARRGALAR